MFNDVKAHKTYTSLRQPQVNFGLRSTSRASLRDARLRTTLALRSPHVVAPPHHLWGGGAAVSVRARSSVRLPISTADPSSMLAYTGVGGSGRPPQPPPHHHGTQGAAAFRTAPSKSESPRRVGSLEKRFSGLESAV